ncbi:MAG TPA: AtpZ/AtpI family protein [Myxococcota bacterium]|nr:AtpZ/AtpI family protein [Myxococcota bacterium]HQK52179.1 AtpZ/AtpI family protein [Myxococcota bacterium]
MGTDWRSAMAVASLGIEMAVCLVVGWWIGSSLDEATGIGPWGTVIWVGIGAGAAFRGLWRTAKRHWPRDGGP